MVYCTTSRLTSMSHRCMSFNSGSHRKTRPEYGNVALTDLLRNESSKNSIFQVNAPTFSIMTPKVFIVHHWFQHSQVPKQIRNLTIPKIAWNGLNILSYDEKYCLLRTPTTEWDGWNIRCVYVARYTVFHGYFSCVSLHVSTPITWAGQVKTKVMYALHLNYCSFVLIYSSP